MAQLVNKWRLTIPRRDGERTRSGTQRTALRAICVPHDLGTERADRGGSINGSHPNSPSIALIGAVNDIIQKDRARPAGIDFPRCDDRLPGNLVAVGENQHLIRGYIAALGTAQRPAARLDPCGVGYLLPRQPPERSPVGLESEHELRHNALQAVGQLAVWLFSLSAGSCRTISMVLTDTVTTRSTRFTM